MKENLLRLLNGKLILFAIKSLVQIFKRLYLKRETSTTNYIKNSWPTVAKKKRRESKKLMIKMAQMNWNKEMKMTSKWTQKKW
jgi:hypothetical protein